MFIFDLTACQAIGKTIKHGGGEYASIVFDELVKRNVNFSCVYTTDMVIDSYFLKRCKEKRIEYRDYKESDLISTLKSMNCTTFYSAMPYLYGSLDFTGINFIGTIHGLRDLEIQSDEYIYIYENTILGRLKAFIKRCYLYKRFSFKRNYARFRNLFDNKSFRFVVVSNHTKYSVLTYFPYIKADDIKVFYSPRVVESVNHIESNDKFYLIVSGNRWLKNSFRALMAIDNLISNGLINHRTIITGDCPNTLKKKLHNKEKFEFLSYVSDEELSVLMKKAYCLLYPSLNEGFGYPPLQAMGSGTPVIASSFCSIPEICGNSVLYFNPYSIKEIENRLLQIEDKKIRLSLIEMGYERFTLIANKQDEDLIKLVDYILGDD